MHHSEILIALSGDNLPEQTGLEYIHSSFRQAVGGEEIPIEQVAEKIEYLLAAEIVQGDDQHYGFTSKWLRMGEAEQYKWFETKYRSQQVALVASDFDREASDGKIYVLSCQTCHPYFAQTLFVIKLVLKVWVQSANGKIALEELDDTLSLLDIEDYCDGHFTELLAKQGVVDLRIDAVPLAWHPIDGNLATLPN